MEDVGELGKGKRRTVRKGSTEGEEERGKEKGEEGHGERRQAGERRKRKEK